MTFTARNSAIAILSVILSLVTGLLSRVAAEDAETQSARLSAGHVEFFEKQIRPLLAKHCDECHGADIAEPQGALRLDSRSGLRRGGASGPAVVPGEPEKSLLIKAVRYADPLLQMPPDGPLAKREVDALVKWVRLGAPDPRDGSAVPMVGESPIAENAGDWWSFQPVRDVTPPRFSSSEPDRTDTGRLSPIDAFILAKLEANGLRPTPPADKRTLIRRATFDVTGLPP
ncbi:MAG: c-type cytochrome domain-containing protein, partial [Planctomycetaceae bacterium]